MGCKGIRVCHCLCVSPVSALVSQAHRCLMAILMPVGGRFSVNTHTVAHGGGERDGGTVGAMAEGRRFAFNEGKAGRHTVDDAEGREAGR